MIGDYKDVYITFDDGYSGQGEISIYLHSSPPVDTKIIFLRLISLVGWVFRAIFFSSRALIKKWSVVFGFLAIF